MSSWVIPKPPADVAGQAVWMAQNMEFIREWDQTMYHIKRRVKEYVRDQGPVDAGDHHRLELEPDGYEYNAEAVAEVMPALIRNATLTVNGPFAEISRALSIVEEEFGEKVRTVQVLDVDKKGFQRVIKAGGKGAEMLAPCRTPKGKLAIV